MRVRSVFTVIFEILFMAVLHLFGISSYPNEIALVYIFFFSLAYFIDILNTRESRQIKHSLIAGYIFRVLLLCWDTFASDIYALPNSSSDAHGYYISALANAGDTTYNAYKSYGGLFSQICGSIWHITGISKMYMQFLILCTSLITLHVANRIMRLLGADQKAREIAMLVLCLLPNYAILSVLFLRECPIATLIAISLLLFVKWFVCGFEKYYWMSFAIVLIACAFHGGCIGVLIGYLIIRFLYNPKSSRIRISFGSVILSIFSGFTLVYLYTNYGDIFFGKLQNVQEIGDIASTTNLGGSSYANLVGNSDSIFSMIRYTPIRVLMFQFTPFVWQIRDLSDIIAFLFNALFYFLVWFKSVKYISQKNAKHRSIVIALLIIWFTVTFVFSWGTTNIGTAVRHRDKMIIFAGILLGLTWNTNLRSKSESTVPQKG